MSTLKYNLIELMKRNVEGSYSLKAERKKILIQCAAQLKEQGFKFKEAKGLKPKHVDNLLKRWKSEGLSNSTIKNRMSHIRWWADKVGKSSMLPKSNSGANQSISIDIDKRSYVPTESKAKELDEAKLSQLKDPLIKLSLQLQREFGLRREEAIKFRPSFAIRGETLKLKASWCKGGRSREVPIQTESQRRLLSNIVDVIGSGSLIQANRSYIQQLRVYERETSRVGLDKNHGLRHSYAQQRYYELTNWKAPIVGGPSKKEMSVEQKQIDREARLQISKELGHGREQITVQYLGR